MKTSKKCPSCSKSVKSSISKLDSGILSKDGTPILVNSRSFNCKKCGYSWMSAADSDALEDQLAKATWQTLDANQIVELREALGFKTKTQAAKFLGLNLKAFTKWEQGYTAANFSTDLLLRLAAHSLENVKFIKDLHFKHFKYEPRDYETVCAVKNVDWLYRQTENLDILRNDQSPEYLDDTQDDYVATTAYQWQN